MEDQHETRRAPGTRRNKSQSICVRKRIMRQANKLQEGLSDGALDSMWDGDEAAVSSQSPTL